MVYQIIFKKRFQNKLEKLLTYIENEFDLLTAQRFARLLDTKLQLLTEQPFIGTPSVNFPDVRSILAGKHNRVYYRIEGNKIIVLNMCATGIHPRKNRLR